MKKKILIVDDDADIAQHLQELLQLRYEARVASNGFDALHLMNEQSFDVILLDLRMPGLDGAGFIAEVHRRQNGDTPIVLVSANADLAQEARKLGVKEWLTKPFDIEALEAIIERVTSGQAA